MSDRAEHGKSQDFKWAFQSKSENLFVNKHIEEFSNATNNSVDNPFANTISKVLL